MARPPSGAGRRPPRRRPQRRRYLVACEGETEVEYFRRLSKRLGGAVAIRPVHRHSAPEHVLDLALTEREANDRSAREAGDPGDVYDEVWIVVDVDTHAHLTQTLAAASRAGVNSALSGPCFEVWLVLHVEDRRAAFATSKAAKERWEALVGPARTIEHALAKTDGNLATALARADALLATHDRNQTPRHRRRLS